jgi:hypothetical protein
MFLGIQVLGILFGLFMLYLTFLHGKRKEFTNKEGIFWILVWILFIFISMVPNSLNFLVRDLIGLSRPLDFFIIAGFMFLIGSTFYTYTIVRKNQNRVEEIIRKVAIERKK